MAILHHAANGAHLDPGEKCDCDGAKKETALLQQRRSQANVPAFSLADPRPEVKPMKGGDSE